MTVYFVNKNFCIRYGSHCAFLLNNFLKENLLRVSFGVYNTESDVKLFLDVLNRFIQKNVKKIENPLFDFHKDMEFDSYQSKTGGKFCILEVCELIAELFGKASKIDYKRTHSNIKAPLLNKKHRIFIMLSPAMCNNAVNSAGELYYKLFDQGSADFDFINVPFGKNPKEFLKSGTIMHVVTNKKKINNLKEYKS